MCKESVSSLERFCSIRFWKYLYNKQNVFWEEFKHNNTMWNHVFFSNSALNRYKTTDGKETTNASSKQLNDCTWLDPLFIFQAITSQEVVRFFMPLLHTWSNYFFRLSHSVFKTSPPPVSARSALHVSLILIGELHLTSITLFPYCIMLNVVHCLGYRDIWYPR